MSEHLLPKQLAGLSRLVQLEWDVRQARDHAAVGFIAVNDTHRLVSYDHAILWRGQKHGIVNVSGGLKVEPNAPQIRWFKRLAAHLAKPSDPAPVIIQEKAVPQALRTEYSKWIGSHALWVPLTGPGKRLVGGLIFLRATAFNESEIRTLDRLGNTYGSAFCALNAPKPVTSSLITARRVKLTALAVALALAVVIPVPMTVLAEARVSPSEPFMVSAPIDGVISAIAIKPNQNVIKGQLLLNFDQTELSAAQQIAQKRVAVLDASSRSAEAQAFSDPKARAEIALLRAKLAEGRAELSFARERLAKVALRATGAGIALFDDANEWIGRPVKVGERVMVIADPNKALLEIQVAVEDALFATPGARVDFFLATAPSHPIPARLTKISYSARIQPDQTAKFVAQAVFQFDADTPPPRLGLTGTAKIHGQRVSLGYLLFRKPLAKLRRLLGI